MMRSVILSALSITAIAQATASKGPFNPRAYPLSSVSCSAWDRSGTDPKATDINISYADVNASAKKTLVLVHGWPSLWSTWGNQIQHFEDDYRLLVPNLRGFGSSTHPGDVETSGPMDDIVGDLICMMDNAGVTEATCIGHDWGSQICWEAARRRPDRFAAVAGAVVPYLVGAGPYTPVEALAVALPHLTYQVYFEKSTKDAVHELNTDIRRTLRGTLRSVDSPPPSSFLESKTDFLGVWETQEEIPPIPFMSSDEEDYMVEQYELQGFDHTLQFYTHGNRYESYLSTKAQGNFSIPQPALYLYPSEDPVANWTLAAHLLHSADFIPNLKTVGIEKSAHWPQLEHPEAFNAELSAWLTEVEATAAAPVVKAEQPRDEL